MTTQGERTGPDRDPGDIDLLDLLATLWAGKFWIATVVALSLVWGAYNVLRMEPLYQANGVVQLEVRSGSASALPMGMQEFSLMSLYGGSTASAAEMAIMQSRMVMIRAAEELDLAVFAYPRTHPWLGTLPKRLRLPDPELDYLRPYQWGNERIEVGELTVPPDWIGTPMDLVIIGPERFAITLPDGSRHEGRARERLAPTGLGFSLMVDVLEGPAGREFTVGRMDSASAGALAAGGFSVMEEPPYSSILLVSYVASEPRRAERILDAITRAYVEQNIERSAAEAENSLAFIEEQLPLAEAARAEAQTALNAYRQQQQSVDVDYETRNLLEAATRIEAELNALALREEDLKKRFTVNHPTYQSLLENRAALERQLERIRADTAVLPETQREIFNLTRDLEVAQQVYLQLLNRSQELRVVRASTVGSVRIIDSAQAGGRVGPQTTREMLKYLAIGLLLGVGWVLARRFLRRGIRGAEDIERAGLPVFGTLNHAPEAVNTRRRRGTLPIHALTRPDDLVVEALRSLRTALHFGMLDARTNTVLLTSAAPGAGKSFTAVNLAVVAAQAGQKVCVIDADLRRGYLRRFFGREKGTPGLAEVLAGDRTVDEVLVPGPVEGLQAILTGRYPPNPSELLMRPAFPQLLDGLNTRFDLILIDSPPALAVTDPVVIGRHVGATIMVVRHLKTMAGEIEAVRRIFENAGGKVNGAVLNGYRQERAGRYGGYHYHYNYRYTYRSGRDRG